MAAGAVPPLARSAGVFAGVIVLGLLAMLLIDGLTYLNFGPARYIVEFDNRLYEQLVPPSPIVQSASRSKLHRVIFIDVDKATAKHWPFATGTPREYLANLVASVREQKPAAIFLDFDLRDPSPNDKPLADELSKKDQPPVLLPHMLYPHGSIRCTGQRDRAPSDSPTMLPMALDGALAAGGSVIPVHAELETGDNGTIIGVCSKYVLARTGADMCAELPGAMFVALELADRGRQSSCSNSVAPELWPLRWRIRDGEDKRVLAADSRELFVRISARHVYPPPDLVDKARRPSEVSDNVDLSPLRGAIVIIGATHAGADDSQQTPVGDLSGALVHANMALQLEAGRVAQMPHSLQYLFEMIQLVITAGVVAYFWHPIHRQLRGEEPSIWLRLRIIVLNEAPLALVVALFFHALLWTIGARFGETLYAWHFAGLGLAIGIALTTIVEIFSVVTESLADLTEKAAAQYIDFAERKRRVKQKWFWRRAADRLGPPQRLCAAHQPRLKRSFNGSWGKPEKVLDCLLRSCTG